MISRNVEQINTMGKRPRDSVAAVEAFVNGKDALDGKILALYGLRRTGKTTIMEQILERHRTKEKCAFFEVEDKDTLDDVKRSIIEERAKGVTLICFDEITKADDFISNSAALPDIFAKEGIKIIVTGTDSLGFKFAENDELYDRIIMVNTTHIPYAEHSRVLDVTDIDDYIQYGGLMRKGVHKSDRIIRDYTTAMRYLDSAVTENISRSIKKNPEYSSLEDLPMRELRTILEKLVELYSGKFDRKVMQNQLTRASISYTERKYTDILDADVIDRLILERKDIVRDFLEKINANGEVKTPVTGEMVETLEKYLFAMNVLSVTTQIEYQIYNGELINEKKNHEYYLIQPAIKYYHLQEAKKFIETESYYSELSENNKQYLQNRLDEKIKGDMAEQIVLFDTGKSLNHDRYLIAKPVFYIDGQRKGEYDMLIYDKKQDKYWEFEIKHTEYPFAEQSKHLTNGTFTSILNKKFGQCESRCVLYRGEPFVDAFGIRYLNISEFLQSIDNTKDMELTMSELSECPEKNTLPRCFSVARKGLT